MDVSVKNDQNSAYITVENATYKIIASNEKFKAIIVEVLEQIVNKLSTQIVTNVEKDERKYIISRDDLAKISDADIAEQIISTLSSLNFRAEVIKRPN